MYAHTYTQTHNTNTKLSLKRKSSALSVSCFSWASLWEAHRRTSPGTPWPLFHLRANDVPPTPFTQASLMTRGRGAGGGEAHWPAFYWEKWSQNGSRQLQYFPGGCSFITGPALPGRIIIQTGKKNIQLPFNGHSGCTEMTLLEERHQKRPFISAGKMHSSLTLFVKHFHCGISACLLQYNSMYGNNWLMSVECWVGWI